jgi:hypothetical protein
MARGISRTKRVVYSALIVVAVVVGIELVASLAGAILTGQRFSPPRLQRQREALVASGGLVTFKTPWVQEGVLHPYVGYAPIPRAGETATGVAGEVAAHPPTRRPGVVTVAFVGGSFALGFVEHAAPRLLARLSELPVYRGRTLVPLNLTAGGYKEPQQLMSVVYLLALGAEIDVLVNIDGFNDIALYPTEDARAGAFPAFPRAWHRQVEGTLQGGTLRFMLNRVQLEQRRAALAQAFSGWPWRHVNLANLVYVAFDRDLERRLAVTDQQLLGAEDATRESRPAKGPEVAFANEREMLEYLVRLWQRSSRLLDQLARANGARYYHFLQPNQYVPGSKPMAAAERAIALKGTRYTGLVQAGYPMLQRAGRELGAEGVRFVDLTGAFAGQVDPLYIDGCCHVSPRGNLIVGDLVFDAIRRDLERPPAATPR